MNFYESPALRDGFEYLQQGDVVCTIPFPRFSARDHPKILLPEAESPRAVALAASLTIPDGAQLLTNVVLDNGVVLNQSCDLTALPGKEKSILIARVLPWNVRVKDARDELNIGKRLKLIKKLANPGQTPSLFYLPPFNDESFRLEASVADLHEVACLPAQDLDWLKQRARLRLSPAALRAFQERIGYCFGRFGVPDELYYTNEEWQAESEARAR